MRVEELAMLLLQVELGIPCVVGSSMATKILKENELVTVNGYKGLVYAGDKRAELNEQIEDFKYKNEKTATKSIFKPLNLN